MLNNSQLHQLPHNLEDIQITNQQLSPEIKMPRTQKFIPTVEDMRGTNHSYGAFISPPKLQNPKYQAVLNSPSSVYLNRRERETIQNEVPGKGFNDGFAAEQARYLARLKRSTEKQEKVFSMHLNDVTIPVRYSKLEEQRKRDQDIKQQQERLHQLVRQSVETKNQSKVNYSSFLKQQQMM